jgi:hypothetical protein
MLAKGMHGVDDELSRRKQVKRESLSFFQSLHPGIGAPGHTVGGAGSVWRRDACDNVAREQRAASCIVCTRRACGPGSPLGLTTRPADPCCVSLACCVSLTCPLLGRMFADIHHMLVCLSPLVPRTAPPARSSHMALSPAASHNFLHAPCR